VKGNRATAYFAAVVAVAAVLVSVPAKAFADFSSNTSASLTSTVAKLGSAVPGQTATTQCDVSGTFSNRKFTNTITVKPFTPVSGATGYELLAYTPDGTLEDTSAATPGAGGTLTLVLTRSDQVTGWTYLIKAKRYFAATNTWTSLSVAKTAPVTKTNCT
jgi:hypothetical protein